ncbi:hypothetical protein ACH4E5_04065 [Streptomyces afghaniensis]|uniref:hypothetical protein n=1 Tax=Streptomyces afghaniensis TaxID=66865 RepID=UPI0037ABDF83
MLLFRWSATVTCATRGAMGERDGYAYAIRSPVAREPAADAVRQPVGIPTWVFAGSRRAGEAAGRRG